MIWVQEIYLMFLYYDLGAGNLFNVFYHELGAGNPFNISLS